MSLFAPAFKRKLLKMALDAGLTAEQAKDAIKRTEEHTEGEVAESLKNAFRLTKERREANG